MNQALPNTFIVGAPKSGTTSLHDYLHQHPDAFMSPFLKEPNYFNPDLRAGEDYRPKSLEQYMKLFEDAGDARIIGESSTWYLLSQAAAGRIREFNPASRIIMMLRNPVDAFYSLHGQLIWSCNEDILDFEQAIAAEPDRRQGRRIPDTATTASGLVYTDVFTYAPQVKRYFDLFPREQVKVIIFDDFVRDTRGVYRQTLDFLGLAPFQATLEVVNAAKPVNLGINRFFARRPALRKLVHQVVPASLQRRVVDALPHFTKTLKRPNRIPPDLRRKYAPRFREDVQRLSDLLQRDLMHWVTP